MSENAVIGTSNTSGISELRIGGVLSDGITYQNTQERIKGKDIENPNENIVLMHNSKIIPKLEEVNIYYKAGENTNKATLLYVKNPVTNRMEFAGGNHFDGQSYSMVGASNMPLDELTEDNFQLKGINKNGYRISEVQAVLNETLDTIVKMAEVGDENLENTSLLEGYSKIMDMSIQTDEEIIPPVPDIENISEIAQAVQKMYDAFNDENKKLFEENFTEKHKDNEKAQELLAMLKKGTFEKLTDIDLMNIDEHSLYKLSDEYLNLETDNIYVKADQKTYRKIRELNPEILAVTRKILNYDIVGYTVDKDNKYHILVNKNISVRPASFYDSLDTVKQNAQKYYEEFSSNFERFKKSLGKEEELPFLKLIGVVRRFEEDYSALLPSISDKERENLSEEELKELYLQKIEEKAEDVNTKNVLNGVLKDLERLKEALETSNQKFISNKTVKTMANEIDTLKELLQKEMSPEVYKEAMQHISNILTGLQGSINAYKETIYSFKIKGGETLQATTDFKRFPRQIGGAVTLNYSEFLRLNKYDENDLSKILFSVGIKEGGKEEKHLYPFLKPLFGFKENEVMKFNFGASKLDKLVSLVHKMNSLKEKNIEDEIVKNEFKKVKDEIINSIKEVQSQKGSGLFKFGAKKEEHQSKMAEFFKGLKGAKTPEEFIKVFTSKESVKDILNIPNTEFVIKTSFANSDNIKNYIDGKELNFKDNEKYTYIKAEGAVLAGKTIKELNEKNTFSLEEAQNQGVTYKKVFLSKLLQRGDVAYYNKKENRMAFLGKPSLNNANIKQIINKNFYENAKVTADEKAELQEKYGYKRGNLYSKIKNLNETLQNKIKKVKKIEQEKTKEKIKQININPKEVIDDINVIPDKEETLVTEALSGDDLLSGIEPTEAEIEEENPFNFDGGSLFEDDSSLFDAETEAPKVKPKM